MSIGVFLDRDGTVNEEVDFLSSPDELHLLNGSASAIREANELGLTTVIVTNQSGIARGLLTEERLMEIHHRLEQVLEKEGARIDAIYFCPHLPGEGNSPYYQDCSCRKPKTGMVLHAAERFGIDLSRSFVVGDRMIDIEMGKRVGATTIIVRTGYGEMEISQMQEHNVTPDYVAENLLDAMQYIKKVLHREHQPTSNHS
jgi:D-glycero-D-manno-heptose 1,7-bisphosphate phosphatase